MILMILRVLSLIAATLRLHSELALENRRVLTKVEGPLEQGLSVSPDRKSILFCKSATSGADLMLIENFR